MAPVLRAYVPDLSIIPGARYGCSGLVMKVVLLGLADSAHADGTNSHPGTRVLAEFAQCHTDTVTIALRGLEHLGAIHKTAPGGPGRCATYTVDMIWVVAQSLCAGDPREESTAGHPRKARGSDPRKARGSDPRSSVLPSVTSYDGADQTDETGPSRPSAPPWIGLNMTKDEWIAQMWAGHYHPDDEEPGDG